MIRQAMAVVGLAALAIPAGIQAQDTEWNRYTLEELGGVYVSSEIAEPCVAAGVSDASLRSGADVVLGAAEVELLTEMGMLANPALPELRLSVDCAPSDGGIVFTVSVRMHQAVQMVRDPQITLSEAVTWYASSVGIAAADGVSAAVGSAVEAQVGAFAVAYTEANAG